MRQIRILFLLLYFTQSTYRRTSSRAIWADNTPSCYWYALLWINCYFKALIQHFLNKICLRKEERKRVRCIYKQCAENDFKWQHQQNRGFVIFLFPACVGERFTVSLVHEAGQNWSYFLSQKFMTAQYVHKSILCSHWSNYMTSAVYCNSTLQSLNSGNWQFTSKYGVQAAFSFQHGRK